MEFGLPEQTITVLKNYFAQKSEIDCVKIFGSRARGDYRRGSDIDFAVWIKSENILNTIKGELDELPTPYKFDVIDYARLENENLKNSIDTEGLVFYSKME